MRYRVSRSETSQGSFVSTDSSSARCASRDRPLILYRLVALLTRPLIRVAFRPEVRGTEHLPAEGGFVLAANHLSGFDVWALSYALFPRPTRNMAKNQLFKRPLLGPLMWSLGGFPARSEGAVGGVVAAAALAAGGEAVVIYPEG